MASAGGGLTTVDPSDFGEFIDFVISQFEVTRMPVDRKVVRYIKKKALLGGTVWENGVRNGDIDVTQTQAILMEALDASATVAESVGHPTLDLTIAQPTFEDVVESRWHCPFPWLIC